MLTFSNLERYGRLGNQLWQIAGTIGMANTLGVDYIFPHWSYTNLFNVPKEKFNQNITNAIDSSSVNLVQHIAPDARSYLQDMNLWREIDNVIKSMFQPSKDAFNFLSEEYPWFFELPKPILSVHVRRGDNVTEGPWKYMYHPPRPLSYYTDAIRSFGDSYASIIFFSDDINWCIENFSDLRPTFFKGIPRPKEHEPDFLTAPVLDWIDLQLMSMCDMHVISNSTYAWWGSFLSSDNSPVYPWPWFGPALQHIDASLMFPESWKKLEHEPEVL